MLSILLVDDERSVVDTLEATIPWNQLGIETIYTAVNGEEALLKLSKHTIDIVLTDIQMPGISGLELIKRVSERGERTKCLLLSGYAEFEFAQEAIKSQALEYLLKPISDEELIEALSRIVAQIKKEWELVGSYHKAAYTLKENLPLLRGTLLEELIQGRKFPCQALEEKMAMLELPYHSGDRTALLLIRVEEGYSGYGEQNRQLLDFAIHNIFEEMAERHFQIWSCKDVHDYAIFLVKAKHGSASDAQSMLVEAAAKLQDNVNSYLKSRISIAVSHWGSFPASLSAIYQTAVSEMSKRLGNDCELFITVTDPPEKVMISTLQTPYEPPTLIHLMEAGRWEAAEQKINGFFREITDKQLNSMEHLMEIYFIIAGAYTYIAHKSGALLEDMLDLRNSILLADKPHTQSMNHMRRWSLDVLHAFKTSLDTEWQTSRSNLIQRVQAYIDCHLSGDVSLRAVADAVYLHPNYLSTLYKAETGEGISEYSYRLRMGKAVYYLANTQLKIYEVAKRLGYHSPHYFIKVFKKHYGMTPQEYRDSNGQPAE